MATFGLKMYKADGVTVIYDSSSVTWNQVDQVFVAGSSSENWTYPVLVGKEILVVQMLINQPVVTRRCVAHTITTSNTTGVISISGGTEDAYFLVFMR